MRHDPDTAIASVEEGTSHATASVEEGTGRASQSIDATQKDPSATAANSYACACLEHGVLDLNFD